ncbi:MAG: exodeoxyribonuclease VIII [Hyphomicrobium sp.]|jgi:hypothetical protein
MDNMQLWRSVCVTDPGAVKAITGKQYKGNSPKPYWIIQRATETFGPCGIGWGINVLNERFERFGDESLHIATVRVWYVMDGKRGEIVQMGQTRAEYTSAGGKHIVDEDAPKKSVTDGMVKCLSMLGFAGDIFSGQWDDSKYVEWAKQETERRESPTLTDEQVSEITGLLDGRDFKVFMEWVSKCVGKKHIALKDVSADAYIPIIKRLTAKQPTKEAA